MWAADLLKESLKVPSIVRELRARGKSVCQGDRSWKSGGRGRCAPRDPRATNCRLGRRLRPDSAWLGEGPAAHGWTDDQVWTTARVCRLIGRYLAQTAGSACAQAEGMWHRVDAIEGPPHVRPKAA